MWTNFRERADLTKIIRSILDSYPAGSGILRELLQNSDDAKATTQTFILDLRTHPNQTLVDANLRTSQGPALVATNDTFFTEQDWKAISNLHSSSKTADESKIGKFGIGVRACYHVTDNPQFLSEKTLVIFDPHERFSEGREGGVKIELTAAEREAYADQLVAFSQSLEPSENGVYPGTVVRLPLRTQEQAPHSTIKQESVEPAVIMSLFKDFVEGELRVVMLFLKHIRSITLKVIHPNGSEEFFGRAEITDMNASTIEKRQFARSTGARQESFRCTITITSSDKSSRRQSWRIVHRVCSTEETSKLVGERVGYNVVAKLAHDKLFSHVALAFPVDPLPSDGLNGRLFTLLPLPIHTGFPVHMHAILALTQDRLSLRNIEETGTHIQSRERLLVWWNKAIFDKFLPETWSTLLNILVNLNEVADIWSAWPSRVHTNGHDSGYWSEILKHLLQRVVELDLAVFPTYPNNAKHISLSSAYIASSVQDPDTLRAFSNIGIKIVKPPKYIFDILSKRKDMTARMLHPNRLGDALKACIANITAASDKDKDLILRYLVLDPGTLDNALELPLLPSFKGPRISLSRSDQFCLIDKLEGQLFGDNTSCNGHLVPLAALHSDVKAVLLDSKMKNVRRFSAANVQRYLEGSKFGSFYPAQDEIHGTDVSAQIRWLAKFWPFVAQWTSKNRKQLRPLIGHLHLLPTSQGTLRKLDSLVFQSIVGNNPVATMDAWGILGVRFLHSDISASTIRELDDHLVLSPYSVSTLVEYISPQTIPQLNEASAILIRDHLVLALRQAFAVTPLNPRSKEIFLQLPIFPLRVPITGRDRRGGWKLSQSSPGTATGNLIYLSVDDSCPVPVLDNGVAFFDVTATSGNLGTLIDGIKMKSALKELGVLSIAIDHLTAQPPELQDALITRIIARLPDLPTHSINKLSSTPFVSVVGSTQKLSPSEVIDPRCELAPLYAGESGKLPSGRWAEGRELNLLTAHVPFQHQMTATVVEDRVSYFSQSWSADELPRIFDKAHLFLHLLDTHWSRIGRHVPAGCLSRAWMPISKETLLEKPSECRDASQSHYLFDLVFRTASRKVHDKQLRESLGWTTLSIDVLRQQLSRALSNSKDRHLRLYALITELSRRILSEGDISSLQEIVLNQAWIPVDQSGTLSDTNLALLRSQTRLPGGRFRAIPHSLLDPRGRSFFLRMGCKEDPPLPTLLGELQILSDAIDNPSRVTEAIHILEEVAKHSAEFSQEITERILIPVRDGSFYPIAQTFFVDSLSTEFLPETGYAAHPGVSESLARQLGLQFLSSLELGNEGDEDDDLQMGEAFTKRVEGVLKEHDIKYAFNEFLANAVDAGAKEFSVILDERVWECGKVVAPGLAPFQRQPSLFLYNDAAFKQDDFIGLRKVGQGGKRSNPDSIGRYGLGALGLFHFGDLAQILSREHLLILDPSGTHLPPLRRKPRTSLLLRISEVARRFPDQLAPFESLCGFSASAGSYPKTLFRIPLRNASSPLSSTIVRASDCLNLLKEQCFNLANDAMLFTGLTQISAAQRHPSGNLDSMWSVEANRPWENDFEDREILVLKATDGPKRSSLPQQRWLVSRSALPISQVPPEHTAVVTELGLQPSTIGLVTRLALRLDSAAETFTAGTSSNEPSHFLFSTLRLPVRTSLPVHISAPFAISSDRRHIRFDPVDHNGHRLPHAAFNLWILQRLIPPLFISSLAQAAQMKKQHHGDPFARWPRKSEKEDEISRYVIEAFYELAVKSPEPIFCSVAGHFIAPVDAVIPNDKTPVDVARLLFRIKPPNYAEPTYAVRRMLTQALVADSPARQIRFVDAAYVGDVLRPWSAQLISHFNTKTVVPRDIEETVRFLLMGNASISDLPLLILADGTLATTGSSTRYVCRGPIPSIFDGKYFLQVLDPTTEDLLVKAPDVNVAVFDKVAVLSLLKTQLAAISRCTHSDETATWITRFWECYDSLPGPPTLAEIESFPLIPTTDGDHVSLRQCARDDVLRRPVNHLMLAEVVSAVEKTGFTFCIMPSPARESSCKHFEITTFLTAIESPSSPFSGLSEIEVNHLCDWIQAHLYEVEDRDLRATVRTMPIWNARKNGQNIRCSANELKWLPSGVSPELFDEFMPPGFAIAAYSNRLCDVMYWLPNRPALTSDTLRQYLTIPNPLSGLYGRTSVNSYSTMLSEFLKLPGTGMVLVPDGELRMRPVEDLYDQSVPLFREAFQSCTTTRFPHPGLVEGFTEQLQGRGLNFDVDWPAFLLCAETVNADLTQRHLAESVVEARATAVYQVYSSTLPGIIMGDVNEWRQLDRLRFIPRLPQRSTSFSFDPNSHCQPIPHIATPSQLLRAEYEPIAWSQRGLFLHPPSSNLTSLNKTLGVPTVQEVVNHLTVLALQVAPEHPGNRSLLQQLRATYKWLNENKADDVRQLLISRSTDPLFLNVDDPNEEEWVGQWKSAEQLQFDIPYDYENTFKVRGFLQEYRVLLLAVGAGQHHTVQFNPTAKAQDSTDLRSVFDEMRKARQRTDLMLLPGVPGEDFDKDTLGAHWTFLAAAIPHVRMSIEWHEGSTNTYIFPGTYFGARAVLDFVYTGKIEATPSEGEDAHMNFLRDLLELLPGADQWGMSDLKDEVGRVIHKWSLLSSATYWKIEEEADKYDAKGLLAYCHEFKERNPKSVGAREDPLEQMEE
ncbi:hypothetical protein C8F01DRAFT_1099109 [Mycena amicta]|nr:hypothetical protein C8F01DRAFT_1099109 [Mycena amicta]